MQHAGDPDFRCTGSRPASLFPAWLATLRFTAENKDPARGLYGDRRACERGGLGIRSKAQRSERWSAPRSATLVWCNRALISQYLIRATRGAPTGTLLQAGSYKSLPADATPTIDRDNLPGDVGGVAHEIEHTARNVIGVARAIERNLLEDRGLRRLAHGFLRPKDGAR